MKKIFTFVVLTALSIVAVVAAATKSAAVSPQAEGNVASLTVTVTDASDTPLPGALVTFDGKTSTTNDAGVVTFDEIDASKVAGKTVPVSVHKDGYDPYEGEADFTESNDATLAVKLAASKGSITIKVFNEKEDPVADAYVTFNEGEYFTDENGEVNIKNLNAPDFIGKKVPFTAYKDGYEFFEGQADFTEGFDAYATAVLTPAKATLSIKVVDEEWEPVADAAVTFNEGDYTSDENGNVNIKELYAPDFVGKTFPVTVYKDGYEFFEGEADFSEGIDANVVATLKAEKGTLTIKVVDEEYEPIPDAYVTFNEGEYYSNESGEVKIIDLNAPDFMGKTFPVTAYKDGYQLFEGEADFTEGFDAHVVAILKAETATLTVRVVDEEYEPVPFAIVTFNDEDYTTDVNGELSLKDLNAPDFMGKTFPIIAFKDGYEPYEGEADFTETSDVYVIATLKPAEATLTVKVFSGEDVVEGATVTFNGNNYTTDSYGSVVISGINALDVIGKTVPVTVTKGGYKTFEGEADFTETIEAYLIVDLEPDPSAINGIYIDGVDGDTKVYDLQGRPVNNPANGQIYIVNGKKILVK